MKGSQSESRRFSGVRRMLAGCWDNDGGIAATEGRKGGKSIN